MTAFERIPVRLRLSLAHATWMALLLLGIGYTLYKIVENNLHSSVDSALIASARSVRDARFAWLDTKAGRFEAMIDRFLREPLYVEQYTGERFIRPYAQIISVSGKVHSKTSNIKATLPVTPTALARAEAGLSTFETFTLLNQAPLRQVTLPVFENHRFTGEIIQVGASMRQTQETLRGTGLLLWFVLPFALLVSVILGYILTASALKPVRLITKAAANMGIEDLGVRLPLSPAKDELRELSKTFNQMFDRLEDAVKRLRRFTGDVSHELRTPLTVLRGEAELALRRQRTPEEYQQSLQSIADEARNMTDIIEDLLLLAKADSHTMRLTLNEVTVQSFVNELCDSVSPIFESRQVSIERNIIGAESFFCARSYLFLALRNILLNAAKHSAPQTSVALTVRTDGPHLIFTIQDQGEGIPAEDLPFIFDPFFRSDTARNRASGGVGIGLSLALALVKLHSGNIEVESEVGRGTTFYAKVLIRPVLDKTMNEHHSSANIPS